MGWGDCGVDSRGRSIGYAYDGKCDYPGCSATVTRGLDRACGGMHGEFDIFCEGYYCSEHLTSFYIDDIITKETEPEFFNELETFYSDFIRKPICKTCLMEMTWIIKRDNRDQFYTENPNIFYPKYKISVEDLEYKFMLITKRLD